MKECVYYILPGAGGGERKESGTLYDLLASIPYLFSKKRLPPLAVINSILAHGIEDAGMSGGVRWDPFTISSKEFRVLADHCLSLGFDVPDAPEWVSTRNYFQIWEFEIDHGIPAEKHKELSDAADEADRRLKIALDEGRSEEVITKLHLEAYCAGEAVSELINEAFG